MGKKEINANVIGDLFFEFQARLQFFERLFLKERGIIDLTPNEVKVLYIIGISNMKSMGEIAGKLRITHGTLSITVNSLVEKGYVTRTRNKQDRRVIILYLTDRSLDVIKHYALFYYRMISKLIDAIGTEKAPLVEKILAELNHILENNA